MSFRSLYVNIVTFLRAKVTDPISRGSNWIFFGNPDVEVAYPIVVVTANPGGTRREIAIGDEGSRFSPSFMIEIYTDKDTSATVNSSKYIANELLLYIADLILTAFVDNRLELFNSYSIIDAIPSPPRVLDYDEPEDQHRVLIPITVQFDKDKA